MKHALLGTVVIAAIATFGDWIWATFLSRHLMVAGLLHGALLCLAMGAVVGRSAGRPAAGAAAGLGIGFAAAGLYYLLAPVMRFAAMLVAWFALWVMLAMLYYRLANGASAALAVTRGIVAGAASGLAFYLVSAMWTRWNPQDINYADHFARWAFAFAPGFAVIHGGRSGGRDNGAPSDVI